MTERKEVLLDVDCQCSPSGMDLKIIVRQGIFTPEAAIHALIDVALKLAAKNNLEVDVVTKAIAKKTEKVVEA